MLPKIDCNTAQARQVAELPVSQGVLSTPSGCSTKTTNPAHMKTNTDVDFVIADADMDVLKSVVRIKDYGDASMMPVFGGKRN